MDSDVERWDIFRDPPEKVESDSEKQSTTLINLMKLLKLFIYISTFIIMLATSVISKGTFLFMASQISPDIGERKFCSKNSAYGNLFMVDLKTENWKLERVGWIWALIFVFMVPEFFTFLRSLRICLFKSWKKPLKIEFATVLITESLSAIGTALLVFVVIPNIDSIKGAMLTNAICFVPSVLHFLSRNGYINITLDIVAAAFQSTALFVWPIIASTNEDFHKSTWLIPVSLVLISIGWWENFVSYDSPIGIIRMLGEARRTINNKRYFYYLFASPMKIVIFLITIMIILWVNEPEQGNASISPWFLFRNFTDAFSERKIILTEILPIYPNLTKIIQTDNQIDSYIFAKELTAIWVLLINITSSWLCFVCGRFVSKILIQNFSYGFPINLSVPVTISILVYVCSIYVQDPCDVTDTIPYYLFFNAPKQRYLYDYVTEHHVYIWILWLISQSWITAHIWISESEKLTKTEKLFVRPWYDAFFIDQSMALNRRREKIIDIENDTESAEQKTYDRSMEEEHKTEDTVSKIYACATMWHETREEMMEFLKSIFRLDADQSARRIVRETFKYINSDYYEQDYYELETHVFFDNAFEKSKLNKYVLDLIDTIDKAASAVHETHLVLNVPVKYETPYGGRLVWTLPGKTELHVHLKDVTKIRTKKRWSQVMYMYYLLGFRLMDIPDSIISLGRKEVIAANTFLLALDGDIDFQPEALLNLLIRMKRDLNVAAACGRIHPIGSGYMAWYQKFEYAIGHWFQKATEHVIGCVLCSPGCFSLFRAKALMDDNVMKKYTTKSQEAKDYVQYDQGEDRWLCTLLLQQGYRVEYSAASDAYTHCPEEFKEFYNQRRRWMPSTIANILDLIGSANKTIKINDNISTLYIVYQIVLMISTILGPGSIFLMLVGAFVVAFDLDNQTSFFYNLIPILIFSLVCYVCETDVQLFVANIISAFYTLVMIAVLVGIILQTVEDGILAPSSLFLFSVVLAFIIAALLHPKEMSCLLHGFIYYITIPSMYMLLVLYSIFNMNIVTWGTRETENTEQKPANESKQSSQGNNGDGNNAGSFELSLFGVFKCMLCTHKKLDEEKLEIIHISEGIKEINEKLKIIEEKQKPQYLNLKRAASYVSSTKTPTPTTQQHVPYSFEIEDSFSETETNIHVQPPESTANVFKNSWFDEKDESEISKSAFEKLDERECTFWEKLIKKYLNPNDQFENEETKKEKTKKLKDLRDKWVFAFFMINALFVLTIFLLTINKDVIYVRWPFAQKVNITYMDNFAAGEVRIGRTYLYLEPIGFVFLLFFALLLACQFTAMLFHRWGTLSEFLVQTKLDFFKKEKEEDDDEIAERDVLRIVKKKQVLKHGADSDDSEKSEEFRNRRKTLHKIQRYRQRDAKIKKTLDDAFEERYNKMVNKPENPKYKNKGIVRRETIKILAQRRNSKPIRKRPISAPVGGYGYLPEMYANSSNINDIDFNV